MNIKNKKLLKRVLEVSVCSGLILTTLSGCSNNALEQQTIEQTQEDDSSLISYKDLITYKYYIICIDDASYEENVYITRLPSLSSIDNLEGLRYEYYYSNVFVEEEIHIMGSVYYNRENKTLANRSGTEILYAISLVDYLEFYGVDKESFSKTDMMAIYNQAKEDYEKNDFKKLKKEKVIIKENK